MDGPMADRLRGGLEAAVWAGMAALAAMLLVGIGLARLGLLALFTPLALVLGPAFVVVLLWATRRTWSLRWSWTSIAVLALAIGGAFANAWMHSESFHGETDSGVYVGWAAHGAREGALAMPFAGNEARATLGGMNHEGDSIVPQFPPGYITALTPGGTLAGIDGILALSAALLGLHMVGLYAVGRSLGLSGRGALVAAAAWPCFYVTVWFSRQPLSENLWIALTLGFLQACLWLRQVGFHSRQALVPAATAAVLAFAAVLTRIDTLALFAVYAAAILGPALWSDPGMRRHKRSISLAGTLVVVAAVAMFVFGLSETYKGDLQDRVSLGLGGAYGDFQQDLPRYAWGSLTAYLVVPFLAAWALLPLLPRAPVRFTLLLVGLPGVVLFFDPLINLHQPWYMRHLWAWLLPAATLAGGALVDAAGEWRMSWRPLRVPVAPITVAVGLLTSAALSGGVLQGVHQDRGFASSTDRIAGLLVEADLVLVSPALANFALPLSMVHGLQAAVDGDQATGPLVDRVVADGGRVLIVSPRLAGSPQSQSVTAYWQDGNLTLVGEGFVDYRGIEYDYRALTYIHSPRDRGFAPFQEVLNDLPPTETVRHEFPVYVYRVLP